MLPSLSLESYVTVLGVLQGVSPTYSCFLGFHFDSGCVEWLWVCSNLICSFKLANFELNASSGRLNFAQISVTYVYAYGRFYSSTNVQALAGFELLVPFEHSLILKYLQIKLWLNYISAIPALSWNDLSEI